jgi:hypothetical protein
MTSKTVGFNGSFYATNSIDSGTNYTVTNNVVLGLTSLGPTVISSNLTSVGTLLGLTVSGPTNLGTLNAINTITTNINANNGNIANCTIPSLYTTSINSNSMNMGSASVTTGTISSIYTDIIRARTSNSNNLSSNHGTMSTIYISSGTISSLELSSGTISCLYVDSQMCDILEATSGTVSSMYTDNITCPIYYGKNESKDVTTDGITINGAINYMATLYIDCPLSSAYAVFIIYFRTKTLTPIASSQNFTTLFTISINNSYNISIISKLSTHNITYNLVINNTS